MRGDILGLIDAAVADWETGPDAVRYNAPRAATPAVKYGEPRVFINGTEIPATDVRIAVESLWSAPVGARMTSTAVVFERRMATLTEAERADFTAYWQGRPFSFDEAWWYWTSARSMESTRLVLSAWARQLATAMEGMGERLQALARAFGAPPRHPSPCFCHPAPFPAARDYRRRTRHRNRRRKR